MMAARLLLTVLLPLIFAASAWAQVPRVANTPLPGTDVIRADGGSEPDTTAPWRYFPLAVGDVLEYVDDEGVIKRRSVEKDTVALGHRYFIVRDVFALNGEVLSTSRRPLRFDTTSATVRALRPGDPPSEDVPFDAYCPFDVPFDTVIECAFELPYAVTGTYDGVLVFGGEGPGTGTDTVRTAVKRYASTQTGFEIRYGADVGIVYEEGDGFFRALTYYRVGGEEHGVEQFPVVAEPVPSAGPPVASLEAWPNPVRERLTLTFRTAEPATVDVIDVLGRVVRRQEVGWSEREVLRIDARGLRAGVYLLRVRTESGASVTRTVTKL